jgi:hypothetical protein
MYVAKIVVKIMNTWRVLQYLLKEFEEDESDYQQKQEQQ